MANDDTEDGGVGDDAQERCASLSHPRAQGCLVKLANKRMQVKCAVKSKLEQG